MLEEFDDNEKIPENQMYAEADMFPEPNVEEFNAFKSDEYSDASRRESRLK